MKIIKFAAGANKLSKKITFQILFDHFHMSDHFTGLRTNWNSSLVDIVPLSNKEITAKFKKKGIMLGSSHDTIVALHNNVKFFGPLNIARHSIYSIDPSHRDIILFCFLNKLRFGSKIKDLYKLREPWSNNDNFSNNFDLSGLGFILSPAKNNKSFENLKNEEHRNLYEKSLIIFSAAFDQYHIEFLKQTVERYFK